VSIMVLTTTCPICGASARNIPSATPHALCFRCIIDGDFEIDPVCLDRFLELDLAVRHRILNRAIKSCDDDAEPCIAQSLIDIELAGESRTASGLP
jgi:hypothetical protein